MLPVISEEISTEIYAEAFQDIHMWRKNMVQYIKEENPEINSAILEVAKHDEAIDLKAVALGAYLAYRLVETASEAEGISFDN